MTNNFYDIAIIGGGVTGLYTAMRLLRSNTHKNSPTAVFEASNRLGGRIHSIKHPDINIPCELGCMRYLKSQRIIANLIEKQFKLNVQAFDTGNVKNHIYYLRGKYINTHLWDKIPYEIDNTVNKNPFFILNKIIDKIKKFNSTQNNNQPTLSAKDWAEIKKSMQYKFTHSPYLDSIQNVGFANLIADASCYETLNFVRDSGEYYAKTINWNAAEALPYSQSIGYKAKDDIEYWCVKDGFTSLCENMANDISAHNGDIHCDMQLKMVEINNQSNTGKYKLHFYDNKNEQKKIVYCNQLILSLPKKAIENIIWLSELGDHFYSNHFKILLNSVRKLPTVRFALIFKTPWWQSDFAGLNGHMVTDLPLRHGYYFGSAAKNKYSVFLSTIDMHQTDYWLPLINNNIEHGTLSETAIAEILKQLKIIHQKRDIEKPIYAAFSNWSFERYGGGFHAWNPGYNISHTMKLIRKPIETQNIYIIGEAFSGIQGWVEGALCTAEKLLEEHFDMKLDEPWLEKDYFYGY